eukprot:349632-Chlamydomonas_euryale.AAC.47
MGICGYALAHRIRRLCTHASDCRHASTGMRQVPSFATAVSKGYTSGEQLRRGGPVLPRCLDCASGGAGSLSC